MWREDEVVDRVLRPFHPLDGLFEDLETLYPQHVKRGVADDGKPLERPEEVDVMREPILSDVELRVALNGENQSFLSEPLAVHFFFVGGASPWGEVLHQTMNLVSQLARSGVLIRHDASSRGRNGNWPVVVIPFNRLRCKHNRHGSIFKYIVQKLLNDSGGSVTYLC